MHWNQGLVLFHALVWLFALVSKQPEWILFVSLHSFFGNWLSYFVGSCQHCGLMASVPDFRKNTRSLYLPKFIEFLFFYMNWHIEHHMFAAVPCYNLRALHEATKANMPKPRSLWGAWQEMRDTWIKQQIDPSFEFDTPLPPEANGVGFETVGSELGDLAPAGLKQRKL